jgi:hypothetical protein
MNKLLSGHARLHLNLVSSSFDNFIAIARTLTKLLPNGSQKSYLTSHLRPPMWPIYINRVQVRHS